MATARMRARLKLCGAMFSDVSSRWSFRLLFIPVIPTFML
jgi:hypothetical protein